MIKQKGFSLIELLVVVAIIGILAAVGVVAYNGYTKAAKIAATKAQGKQICNFATAEIAKCNIFGDSSALDGTVNCPESNKDKLAEPIFGALQGKFKNPFNPTEESLRMGFGKYKTTGTGYKEGATNIMVYPKQVYLTTCYKEPCKPKDPGPNPPIYHEGTTLLCPIPVE